MGCTVVGRGGGSDPAAGKAASAARVEPRPPDSPILWLVAGGLPDTLLRP